MGGLLSIVVNNMKNTEQNSQKIPKHIAIIMDGNGRWAQKRGLPRTAGHKMGIESLKKIVKYSGEIGIEVLTVYAFSTENWKRPHEEVSVLMSLIIEYIKKELNVLHKNGVKINPIGEYQQLPEKTVKEIEKAVEKTKKNEKLTLNVALNYGSKAEITRSFQIIGEKIKKGEISPDEIDEKMISQHLYTKNQPDPDLIIRPSGEKRLSNFLMWQGAYSELWFSDVLWPDFSEEHLMEAINDFKNRDRRFGAVKEKEKDE
jgi:undecaprenyl diphosphate synthase